MADQLSLNTEELQTAGSNLRVVAQEFDSANANSDAAAEAVGHDGLADAIRDFAHGWDDRRAKMVDGIASLADACTGIGDGFEDLDKQFAAVLKGEQ